MERKQIRQTIGKPAPLDAVLPTLFVIAIRAGGASGVPETGWLLAMGAHRSSLLFPTIFNILDDCLQPVLKEIVEERGSIGRRLLDSRE